MPKSYMLNVINSFASRRIANGSRAISSSGTGDAPPQKTLREKDEVTRKDSFRTSSDDRRL